MQTASFTAEELARRIAGETLADLRTVRREIAQSGSVCGLVGQRIRAALPARSPLSAQPSESTAA